MDSTGAMNAATKLAEGAAGISEESAYLACVAPMIPKKALWRTQIDGSYNLLFPNIHIDFAVRDETAKYVKDRINEALRNHNNSHAHFGYGSFNTQDIPLQDQDIEVWELEHLYENKYKFEDSDLDGIEVRNDDSFDKIGYGI